jgi:protein-S-isoprenylcysteine O-methyltransferase Ste14
MVLLRIYLLAGLIIHKAVWESLKRRSGQKREGDEAAETKHQSIGLRLVKGVKVAILAGLVAQTMLPELLPITSSPQILRVIGVTIYTIGLVTAILGRIQLGSNWSDIETAQVLGRQTVVSHGLYRYIRHPIYVGDLLLLAGFELSLNSWLVLASGLLSPWVLWKAVREEKMLGEALPGYHSYCERTKRFIPFVV